jgi:hypothetical protein
LAYDDEICWEHPRAEIGKREIGTHILKLRDGTVMQVLVNAGFTFAEIFELGARVAYAQAWSYSNETSFGDNQLCPAGGMESDGVVRCSGSDAAPWGLG